ncbi:MAG: hypothetical protein K5831_01135 [Brevundimonas sp.]|uniref:hypothetical protein n=1 Tax=Brevundimonas sp. TaxID=1871086 RepID=UPI00259098B7|nr:hypothetical protein [Brevundimonas sp.]MCV0413472.1 hypothetical protein [Brevundimonas sp.]
MTGEQKPGGLEVVEGESVAIMRPFWVSWWGEPGTFELHRPWWISGERDDGKQSICAAVLAQDEFTARLSIQWAHDDKDAVIEWRFAEERPKGWSPFGSRFRQADWMIWPESLTPAEPAEARIRELERQLRIVQNAAKTLHHCRDTELQHLRENATFDHRLRAEHESLMERDAMMTDLLEQAEARATAAEAKLARAVEGLERAREDFCEMADKDEIPEEWSSVRRIDQTLAALQQEGE